MLQSFATINLRFVDTTTAERVISISADGEVKKGGGFLKGSSLSRDSEWGIASETIQKTAKSVVAKFAGGDSIARSAAVAAAGVMVASITEVSNVATAHACARDGNIRVSRTQPSRTDLA